MSAGIGNFFGMVGGERKRGKDDVREFGYLRERGC